MRGVFVALLVLATQASGQVLSAEGTERTHRASAEEVCSFITGKLRDAVPQVPSLCVPKEGDSGLFIEVEVFSPTDVLHGNMRRAWSVALFHAAQELYFGNALDGGCQETTQLAEQGWLVGCRISVSDAQMARRGMRYGIYLPSTMKRVWMYVEPASEEWYQLWWMFLLSNKRTSERYSGSRENAEGRGKEACKAYRSEIEKDPTIRTRKWPIPACSVLLATDSSLYFILDFPDMGSAYVINYTLPLLTVFGGFAHSPYGGAVILRSPWISRKEADPEGAFFVYGLDWVGFLWQEANSGVRDLAEAQVDLLRSRRSGQTKLHSMDEAVGNGAIVRIAEAADRRMLLDLTDGSSWYAVPAGEWCLKVGDRVIRGTSDTTSDVLLSLEDTFCQVQAGFRGGW